MIRRDYHQGLLQIDHLRASPNCLLKCQQIQKSLSVFEKSYLRVCSECSFVLGYLLAEVVVMCMVNACALDEEEEPLGLTGEDLYCNSGKIR